jgi:ectoine hydroxylase-related dioxygenase (phytanoyl-CoA dioxygenase family)
MGRTERPETKSMTATETIPVSDQQVDFYQKNGFIQINDVLSQEELDELQNLTDDVNAEIEKVLPPWEERGAYQRVFLQVVNVWRRDERFKKFTFHQKLGEIARRLLKAEHVRLWHDHLMTKLPGELGQATDWHQDFPYWAIKEPGAMSVWIPMQDVDWENGCMHFVPGSHEWNLNEVIRLDKEEHTNIFDLVKDRSPEEVQRVYCPLKRGSVTFHDGRTFHFAGKNTTDQPRRVLSVIYMADGSTYNGNEHGVSDEATYLKPGDPFGGEFFPVII